MNWFETIVVTKKREDIVNLIKSLMIQHNKNVELPEIQLPTENGKLIVLPDFLEEHGEFEDDDGQTGLGEVNICVHSFHIMSKILRMQNSFLFYSHRSSIKANTASPSQQHRTILRVVTTSSLKR